MKKAILEAVFGWFAKQSIDWTDKAVISLVEKIKLAEQNVPGDGKGASKWSLVWVWILGETGEEIEQHKEGIKDLVGGLVAELNNKKLW